MVDYYEYLAESAPDRVQLTVYGQTNERRPLILAYVSSAENLADLETIRQEHLKNTEGAGIQKYLRAQNLFKDGPDLREIDFNVLLN